MNAGTNPKIIESITDYSSVPRQSWCKVMLRVFIPVVIAIVLFVLLLQLVFVPILREYLVGARKETIEALAVTAVELMDTYQRRVVSGDFSLEDAQQIVGEQIRDLRYGPERKDYFWVHDTDGILLIHPYRTDLVGQSVLNYADPEGTFLFREMIEVAHSQGAGYVKYFWQWKDDPSRLLPKISYVVIFEPWNWIVGTGMYLEDVEVEVRAVRTKLLLASGGILIVLVLLSSYIVVLAVKTEDRRWTSEQARAILVNIVESTSDLVAMSTEDKNLIYINQAGREMLAWSENESCDTKSLLEFYPDHVLKRISDDAVQAAVDSGIWRGMTAFVTEDGREIPISLVLMSHRRNDGTVAFFSCIGRDVSAERLLEAELREANEELRQAVMRTENLARNAEQASRAKSLFLANMSHELRTPLNAVIGCVDLLMETMLNSEQEEYAKVIHASGEVLLFTITDILDLSKIESGKMRNEEVTFHVRRVVASCVDMVRPLAARKDLEVGFELDDQLPEMLFGDSVHLRQTLINLLNNAVKFTDEGRVDLRVKVSDKSSGCCALCFEVEDTGIGLSEEELPIIFEPFRQADLTYTRKYGGTGLGLAICREFVRMMGGELHVRSEKGRGSVFYFDIMMRLPLEEGGRVVPNTVSISVPGNSDEVGKVRILIVEDNEFNRLVTQRMISKMGFSTEEAIDGQQAVEMLEKQRFDLVLMDIQMPRLDGIQATRQLRDAGNDVYIVGLTAHAYQSDRDECLEVGMNDYLSKPVKKEHLVAALRRYWETMRHDV